MQFVEPDNREKVTIFPPHQNAYQPSKPIAMEQFEVEFEADKTGDGGRSASALVNTVWADGAYRYVGGGAYPFWSMSDSSPQKSRNSFVPRILTVGSNRPVLLHRLTRLMRKPSCGFKFLILRLIRTEPHVRHREMQTPQQITRVWSPLLVRWGRDGARRYTYSSPNRNGGNHRFLPIDTNTLLSKFGE